MYEACTDDFYPDMGAMKYHFEFATYPKSSPFYVAINNKVVGKFKDEARGKSIKEFDGWKQKMWCYQTVKQPSHCEARFSTKKRATGIQRAVVAKLRHEQYKA